MLMETLKDFAWFTTHSWSYMQGQRISYITGFIPAWRRFSKLAKQDRQAIAENQ